MIQLPRAVLQYLRLIQFHEDTLVSEPVIFCTAALPEEHVFKNLFWRKISDMHALPEKFKLIF